MFGTEISRYDNYNLTKIEPGNSCNITNATWDAMKEEAVSYGAAVLLEGYVLVRTIDN